ncbi:hypothetical protein FB451DRAFT_1280933 [Mycena latifolia]|nr:hypothetical protein FB451DRAFT_1280933 [Mycena latifolia]
MHSTSAYNQDRDCALIHPSSNHRPSEGGWDSGRGLPHVHICFFAPHLCSNPPHGTYFTTTREVSRVPVLSPMLLLHRIFRGIVSYRVGYSPQQPYPWRWTTPVVLGAFLLLSAVLAAINVPLSAYDIDQGFTYRPNDTLPPLPLNNMIPAILQHPMGGFTPQIMTVGDTVQLNNSIFNFTIVEAFGDLYKEQPVSSFSYFNNPFSDGCDVTIMTADLGIKTVLGDIVGPQLDVTVTVVCHIPTFFALHWSGSLSDRSLVYGDSTPGREDVSKLGADLAAAFFSWSRGAESGNGTPIAVGLIAEPCCSCDASAETILPTQSPCSLLPARLEVVEEYLQGIDTNTSASSWPLFGALSLNTFQSLYHLVRLELGVILENQIYASPEMYNRSIMPVHLSAAEFGGLIAGNDSNYPAANKSRLSTANQTLMLQWAESVRSFNESDRVPVMAYLRPIPRLKPMGSAITSVFVSTFAMLSVLWTIFSIIAGALAESLSNTEELRKDEASSKSRSHDRKPGDVEEQTRGWKEWDSGESSLVVPQQERLSLMVDHNSIRTSIAIAELQQSLARMRMSLKKHGIMEDTQEDHEPEVQHGLRDESGPERPLEAPPVHRTNKGSIRNSVV